MLMEGKLVPYFSDKASEMLNSAATMSDILEAANSCFNHIKRIFTELEDILPFEILRSSRDKANYLLVKEARIIAMTSTHAAIKVRLTTVKCFLFLP